MSEQPDYIKTQNDGIQEILDVAKSRITEERGLIIAALLPYLPKEKQTYRALAEILSQYLPMTHTSIYRYIQAAAKAKLSIAQPSHE